MKIIIAMTRLALLVQPFYVHANIAVAGITRERFQATVHTLLDDEMNWLLAASPRDESSPIGSVPGSRRTLSNTSKRASPHKLRKHMLNETAEDITTGELDILFDNVVSHGWDSVISRSLEDGDNDELFLVCYNSPPLIGIDRKQAILEGLKMSDFYFTPIHSTLEDLCGIVSIPGSVALNWHTQNHGISVNDNSNLALLPWTDVMKIAPNILSQVYENDATDYSLLFSVVKNNDALAKTILSDAIEMIHTGQRQRRQQGEKHVFRDSFSLAKLADKAGSESNHHWSRMLEDKDCSSMLDGFMVTPVHQDSNYQIQFESSPLPDCVASLIVGLSVHPAVSLVGTIIESVELHNMHASWLVQGGVSGYKGNDIFPFHSAGLKGENQYASISDTGLDTDNCYFRNSISTTDSNQVSIFEEWNISSKILRYDHDSSGGDLVDETRHGTHVSATILGSHVNGLGQEKDGVAPASQAHFYDICTGTKCLSPSQRWFDSVNSNLVVQPKVMSASWGTSFLTSYDWTCQQYDSLIAENPLLILIASSGNRGGPHPTIG